VRDLMFSTRRTYGELLEGSEEGIASNILADRLRRLTHAGVLRRRQDPTDGRRGIYCLTEPGIQLLPVLVQLGAWGRLFAGADAAISKRVALLERAPKMRDAFIKELRQAHRNQPLIGWRRLAPPPIGPVGQRLARALGSGRWLIHTLLNLVRSVRTSTGSRRDRGTRTAAPPRVDRGSR
jgi:DNA-binding HxlR family transcriptional regulator